MKLFKKLFQGDLENKKYDELSEDVKYIKKQITEKLFNLLDEKDKLTETYEKNINDGNKKIINVLNYLTTKVDKALDKLDDVLAIVKEFKGNTYEIKKIRPTKAIPQKIGVKSRSKQSRIIKKEKNNE